MPIYDYHCDRCDIGFEDVFCRASDVMECELCKEVLRRLPSTFANKDHQLEADRAYEAMAPGEKYLHQQQLESVMENIQKGTAGRVSVGKRWPSQLKPKALQRPATG